MTLPWQQLAVSPSWQVEYLMGLLRRWRTGQRARVVRYLLHILGVHVMPGARVGRVEFPHPLGIVIGAGVVIEDGAKVWQNVTLGALDDDAAERGEYPTIRTGARIFAGAVVVGAIEVGEGATVGSNAVVLADVPAGATVVGAPARKVG